MSFENVFDSDLADYSGDFERKDREQLIESFYKDYLKIMACVLEGYMVPDGASWKMVEEEVYPVIERSMKQLKEKRRNRDWIKMAIMFLWPSGKYHALDAADKAGLIDLAGWIWLYMVIVYMRGGSIPDPVKKLMLDGIAPFKPQFEADIPSEGMPPFAAEGPSVLLSTRDLGMQNWISTEDAELIRSFQERYAGIDVEIERWMSEIEKKK